jgi:hypothetical protein
MEEESSQLPKAAMDIQLHDSVLHAALLEWNNRLPASAE